MVHFTGAFVWVEEDDYSMEEACSKIHPLPSIAIFPVA